MFLSPQFCSPDWMSHRLAHHLHRVCMCVCRTKESLGPRGSLAALLCWDKSRQALMPSAFSFQHTHKGRIAFKTCQLRSIKHHRSSPLWTAQMSQSGLSRRCPSKRHWYSDRFLYLRYAVSEPLAHVHPTGEVSPDHGCFLLYYFKAFACLLWADFKGTVHQKWKLSSISHPYVLL